MLVAQGLQKIFDEGLYQAVGSLFGFFSRFNFTGGLIRLRTCPNFHSARSKLRGCGFFISFSNSK
jgi:hypothetical protein